MNSEVCCIADRRKNRDRESYGLSVNPLIHKTISACETAGFDLSGAIREQSTWRVTSR